MDNSYPSNDFIGASPAQVRWKVVRGDTASISVEFYENDEATYYDTSTWTYASTAYDPATKISYSLGLEVYAGHVTITAIPSMTANWGLGHKFAELSFDVQVTIDNNLVWTPIVGIVSVINDVTVA
jgi:hypothetical protein